MDFVDRYSLTLHRAIAEKMRFDGDRIVRIAIDNIDRWLHSGNFPGGEAMPLLEWKRILERGAVDEIRAIISEDSDEGQRLRSSTPFTGVLTRSERESYWNECAEITNI